MKNYTEIALQYCDDVLSGKILAGRKVKLAAKRHLTDLSKVSDPEYPYFYSPEQAHRVCQFCEFLTHTKGRWQGEPFLLAPFQVFLTCAIFGWLRKKDSLRRFSQVFALIPRKNGKSALAAAYGLYALLADGEKGGEVYCVANSEKQALEVFRVSFQMAKSSPELIDYYGVQFSGTTRNPTSIYTPSDFSRYEPLIGDPPDGSSPSFAVCDEVHEANDSRAIDTMSTGMGARSQGVLFCISTAGINLASPCFTMYQEAIKILEGSLQKEYMFCIIFDADEEDDYQDFSTWIKANPGYLISVNEEYLRIKYDETINSISKRNINQCKHLNRWNNSAESFIDMLRWEQCKDTSLKFEDFYGKECVVALDLANKIDLCAMLFAFKHFKRVVHINCPKCKSGVTVFDDVNICSNEECGWKQPVLTEGVVVFGKYYQNEERIAKLENEHYRRWVAEGVLTSTEGSMTDFHKIESDLKEISKLVRIKELTFDQREAAYFITNVQSWANFECVETPQTASVISEPMKTVEMMIYANTIWHNGDNLLTWCMSNVVRKQSKGAGVTKYYYPTRQSEALKIDAAVALIMCIGRIMVLEDSGAYQSRVEKGEERVLRVL